MIKNLTINYWRCYTKKLVMLFVLLFVISFSFPHYFLPDVGAYTHTFFEKLVYWFGKNILQIKKPYTVVLISDSTGMYINALMLICIAIAGAFVWQQFDKKNFAKKLFNWFIVFVRYYLALQMLVYGFAKVFKWQFYLPEPNTLFTTIGNNYKDILYWSTIGVSRTYSVFTGLCELLAALLLLFSRTTLLGALITLAIMVNVLLLNVCFDISVKLYSMFLIFLSLLLIVPFAKNLYHFFVLQQPTQLSDKENLQLIVKGKNILPYLKWLVVFVLLIDSLAMYFKENNFNDDKVARPFLHGAYNVINFVRNNDTIPPLLTNDDRWKRVFVHRRGYLITQLMNDEMKDYELAIDTVRKEFLFNRNEDSLVHLLQYKLVGDTTIILNGKFYTDSINVILQKINWKNLPLIKNDFSWTIDE